MEMSAKERSALRKALTSHHGWADYKRATGVDIASMGKDAIIGAAIALNIDIEAVKKAAETSTETESEHMKERTINPHDTAALNSRFQKVRFAMQKLKERDLCVDILKTINEKQNGYATDRQFKIVLDIVTRAEQSGSADTADTASAAPAPAPRVTSSNAEPSAAGRAMYEIMKDAVRADLDPLVNDILERALEKHNNTVRIELTRQGDVAGETEGHQHPLFARLCRALSARQANGYPVNVWLSGPTGSGKTYASRQFAKAAGLDFGFQGACIDPDQLLGYERPTTGVYKRTPFRDRWEHGGVILLDEIDAYDANATLALNGIADGFINFPDREVKRHPDCYIIGAGNTWGEGATATYVGRNRLDTAFLSRFPVKIGWVYDAALEVTISGNERWAKRVQAARIRKDAAGVKHLIDPRQTIAGAALIAQGFTDDEAAEMTYLAGLSKDQIKIVEGR